VTRPRKKSRPPAAGSENLAVALFGIRHTQFEI
jgi:hypothetical protein